MLPLRSFNLKPETFVEMNGSPIVSIDFELQPREIEPVISEVDNHAHQLLAESFALPIRVYADADCAYMLATWSIWKSSEIDHADNAIVDDGNEPVNAVSVFRDSLSPVLARRIRNLKRPFIHLCRLEHLADLFVVVRFGATYFKAFDRHGLFLMHRAPFLTVSASTSRAR